MGTSWEPYLSNRDAAIQLDQIVEITKEYRYGYKADIARIPQ